MSSHMKYSDNPFEDYDPGELMKLRLDVGMVMFVGYRANKTLCLENHHSLRVLLFLANSRMARNGSVYMDMTTFMKYGEISKQTIYRALTHLLNMEVLAKHPARSTYFINPEFIWSERLMTYYQRLK